jgi:hypothetical protein
MGMRSGNQDDERLMQNASGARRPLQVMSYSPWVFIPASLAAAWLVAAC